MVLGSYIHFTQEQKAQAASVDLEDFLRERGETLLSSGKDKRLASDHSVTIRGNAWYDHAEEKGGYAISFVQKHYRLSYAEAVTMLPNRKKPRIAGLCGREEGACDHLSLSCAEIERVQKRRKPSFKRAFSTHFGQVPPRTRLSRKSPANRPENAAQGLTSASRHSPCPAPACPVVSPAR